MTFLSSIVPALREVRAPLLSGYLWLLAGWLLLSEHVPDSAAEASRRGDLWRALVRVNDGLGAPGKAAAASIAAYLVGSMIGEVVDLTAAGVGRRVRYVENMAIAFPNLQYMVDIATRHWAEAQLRLHLVLPVLALGVIVLKDNRGAALLILLFGAALAVHATALVRRTIATTAMAGQALHRAERELTPEDRASRSADVRVRANASQLIVSNAGPAAARDISVAHADDGEPLSVVPSGYLPIEELRSGDEARLPLVLSMGDSPVIDVQVTWTDELGVKVAKTRLNL